MILLIDNYDSFTFNLVDYFGQLNVEVDVRRNDEPFDNFKNNHYAGVVLSPGPEKPQSAGQLLAITAYYFGRTPLLGICLGHQAIGVHRGVQLVKAAKPMHGKLSEIETAPEVLFSGLNKHIQVVRYHSLILKEPPKGFNATAITATGELMAFESKADKAYGIQFHPEAVLTECGLQMLKNWVSFYNIV